MTSTIFGTPHFLDPKAELNTLDQGLIVANCENFTAKTLMSTKPKWNIQPFHTSVFESEEEALHNGLGEFEKTCPVC